MLFLVISTPAPTRPSEVREARMNFWPWVEDKLARGIARSFYPRTGRGAVAVFDVDTHEMLHRLLNEWAAAVPAASAKGLVFSTGKGRTFMGPPYSGAQPPSS